MLLVIDVGNTNIVLGVYKGRDLVTYWRVSTVWERTADEYGILIRELFSMESLDFASVKAVIVSSVVPPLMPALGWMCEKYFRLKPMVVEPGIKTGMVIKYDNPREVGADRIVNAIAAYEKYGGPLVVVDFGTATTFDAISEDGEYLGGAIAPGIGISTDALFRETARLFRIELVKPKSAIGKNTICSMQSGVIFGFVGQVDELVRRISQELESEPFVVATGGLAELISSESSTIKKVDPLLTLEGLRIIYERNTEGM